MGYGGGYGGRGYAANAWDGYCGCGGNACSSCGGCGCNRCCFPLLHGTLNHIGRVFDALLPDPCCRRTCGMSCSQPTCGVEPGCGPVGMPGDPFIDDHPSSVPTPAPSSDARTRSHSSAKMMNYAKPAAAPALKPMPMKTSNMPVTSQPVKSASKKPAGRSVLKVVYDDELDSLSDETSDAPPAAPASVRRAAAEEQPAPVRFAAKPVVRARSSEAPVNPLRP